MTLEKEMVVGSTPSTSLAMVTGKSIGPSKFVSVLASVEVRLLAALQDEVPTLDMSL